MIIDYRKDLEKIILVKVNNENDSKFEYGNISKQTFTNKLSKYLIHNIENMVRNFSLCVCVCVCVLFSTFSFFFSLIHTFIHSFIHLRFIFAVRELLKRLGNYFLHILKNAVSTISVRTCD